MKRVAAVVFAAGKGTRMKSEMPKVLHPILGLPMLEFPLRMLKKLRVQETVVVVGHGAAAVTELARKTGGRTVVQKEPKGTGDALKVAMRGLRGHQGPVLVLNGDMPLLRSESVKRLLRYHREGRYGVTVGSFATSNPGSYGRIVRDTLGRVVRIVEMKDATESQRGISEVNGGVYVFEASVLQQLRKLQRSPVSGEYYVTDLIALAASAGERVGALDLGAEDLQGINTRKELAEVAKIMRDRIVDGWMARGVTFLDPGSVWIHPDSILGADTVVYGNVVLEGRCRVGRACTLYPNVRMCDAKVGPRTKILDGSVIEESEIGSEVRVGPMAHLRPGSKVGANSRVGNFVELKNAILDRGVKASHLSYLGDARVAEGVNIGAGTITCNYDGKRKHLTIIERGVFIGSDTQLVAPVRVGRGAYVGAGTTVTEDVPPDSLVLTRPPQTTVEGWAKRRGKGTGRGK